MCWSRRSWDKPYLCQKVKCDERDTQGLNIVCLDRSEYFWSDLHQILPVLKTIFSISHVYKCQKYFEPGVMKAWKHLLIEGCFNTANTYAQLSQVLLLVRTAFTNLSTLPCPNLSKRELRKSMWCEETLKVPLCKYNAGAEREDGESGRYK